MKIPYLVEKALEFCTVITNWTMEMQFSFFFFLEGICLQFIFAEPDLQLFLGDFASLKQLEKEMKKKKHFFSACSCDIILCQKSWEDESETLAVQ